MSGITVEIQARTELFWCVVSAMSVRQLEVSPEHAFGRLES